MIRASIQSFRKRPPFQTTIQAEKKIALLTISKPVLAGLLLTCVIFGSACFNTPTQDASNQNQDASDQDATAQESFGYAFVTDQELVRGRDDEPTLPSGPDLGSGPSSPATIGRNSAEASTGTSQSPSSSAGEVLVLGDPPEQQVTRMAPEPLPEDWLPSQSSAGILESKTMIIIIVVLLVVMIVASIDVVMNW
jgi:hypothetical protein